MRKQKHKKSIAKKVTRYVSLTLVAALIIVVVASFFFASRNVRDKNRKYSRAVVTLFGDLIAYEAIMDAEENPFSISPGNGEFILIYSEYLIKWFDADNVYVYTVDPENGTKTILAASTKDEDGNTESYTDLVRNVAPTEEEIAVWNGEKPYGEVISDNEFGHEIGTIIGESDVYGNRYIAAIDVNYDDLMKQTVSLFLVISGIAVLLIIGVYIAVYFIIKKLVSRPARELSRTMQEFVADEKREAITLPETDTEEYSMISSAFNTMTDNIDRYLESIKELTRDRERQNTEIDIAARIQKGLLPPTSCDSAGCFIRALNTPAKYVGGDLYDYEKLDPRRTLAVIADVSGKGISAAIFMAVTLILIRQFARTSESPDEILRKVNDTLSANNSELLFVTAFVGIYDSVTGKLTYSNAGHDLPYLVGEDVETLDSATGTPLGLFENESYPLNETSLTEGETLFLYTDGVNETVNGEKRFFGNDRLKETLRGFARSGETDAVSYVMRALDAFSDGAERHDDVTMLALTRRSELKLELKADTKELPKIKDAVFGLPVSEAEKMRLYLAAEELFTNICTYAYGNDSTGDEKATFSLTAGSEITMRFEDGGIPFDPIADSGAPDEYDVDTMIGGVGRFLAFSFVDSAEYEYKDGRNVLTLKKKTEEDNV